MKKVLLSALLLSFFSTASYAANFACSGTVMKDAISGQGAQHNTGMIKLKVSEKEGESSYHKLPEVDYLLEVYAVDYEGDKKYQMGVVENNDSKLFVARTEFTDKAELIVRLGDDTAFISCLKY